MRPRLQTLKPEEAPFGDLFDVSPSGMLILSANGDVRRANPAFCELLGVAVSTLLERSVVDITDHGDRRAVTEVIRRLQAGTGEDTFKLQTRFVGRSGETVHASVVGRLLRDQVGRPFRILIIIADTTDRVRADVAERNVREVTSRQQVLQRQLEDREEKLRESQKMEALGRLAGGIAHDFNNLLTVISSYAALLAEASDEDDPRLGDVREISRAVDSAASLVRQLLMFARRDVAEPRVLDVAELIRTFSPVLDRTLGDQIEVAVDVGEDPIFVELDPVQFEQVLLNLAMNARDAMPTGGRLRIAASAANENAVIEVSDSGVGMDAETRRRAFEPFFTTKPADRGTGLGLATCYGLIQSAGGTIDVASVVGLGTTFRILLPVRAPGGADADCVLTIPILPEDIRVLLVEDDKSVQSITRRILEREGFVVDCASNGAEALGMIRDAAAYDVIVSDILMPRMTGPELVCELRRQSVATPVVFMTGYQDPSIFDEEAFDKEEVLLKPFAPNALLRTIRRAMGVEAP